MSELPLIRCLGCEEAVFEPTRTACPGCGRCPVCGSRRAKKVKECPTCNVPYCSCCGRCPQCLKQRYSDIDPCECGHPNDKSKLEDLVRSHAVVGAERQPISLGDLGCLIIIVVFFALFIWSLISLKDWLN